MFAPQERGMSFEDAYPIMKQYQQSTTPIVSTGSMPPVCKNAATCTLRMAMFGACKQVDSLFSIEEVMFMLFFAFLLALCYC
jgi:hypothetical protein